MLLSNALLPPPKDGFYLYILCSFVCLFVCPSAILLKKSRTYFDDMFVNVRSIPRINRLTFSGDADLDPGSTMTKSQIPGSELGSGLEEFVEGFFICYCNSYKQPRIKHESPRRWFALCECFQLIMFCCSFTSSVFSILFRLAFSRARY